MTKKNSNLHSAKKSKNDEFYTRLTDIEKELKFYKNHFKDKVVLCNCDNPEVSQFAYYFALCFNELGLKKLIVTGYNNEGEITPSTYIEYVAEPGFNGVPDMKNIGKKYLYDSGDFRNIENIELLKQADIVVTNGPFSLFREYVAQLIKYDKKFLIVGSLMAITYKEIFPLIKDNKLWVGNNYIKKFIIPEDYEHSKVTIEDGVRCADFGNILWYTNLEIPKRHESLILCKKFKQELYPKYDNYFAFNVDKVVDIPMEDEIEVVLNQSEYEELQKTDYEWELLETIENKVRIKNPKYGVPITFIEKQSKDQFEIIGIDTDLVKEHTGKSTRFQLNGSSLFARVVIQKKKYKGKVIEKLFKLKQ